ncbi:uncharacterized protein LOC142819918 [Pelodiscus sinensis]|uniref:uncharacterized protein LOC142819918 n=1 Tax=Pelodiscus sinensis TaxID=13735 RepID=UPI003F6B21EC
MAGWERRVAPGRGCLLLCIWTLQFSVWNSLAEDTSATPTTTVPAVSVSLSSTAAVQATNMSTNTTALTCHSFQCSGERCYQKEMYTNQTASCSNAAYCKLYRLTPTNYTAQCSSACGSGNGTEMCMTNRTWSMNNCTMECCNSSLCLRLNATAYGDLPPPTTTAPTTTTPKPPPRNGKICTVFSCQGEGCFKDQKPADQCIVGYDFCEMKKTDTGYVAGCSKACNSSSPVCSGTATIPCYQECCPATPTTSCLKLDGNVHFNGAGQAALAPLLKLLVCGVGLVLHYSLCAFLQG